MASFVSFLVTWFFFDFVFATTKTTVTTTTTSFFSFFYRRIHPHVVDRSHNKYTRPADVRWITIEDLEPDRQYQFWVTAVTNAGEGLSSNVVTQTPSSRGMCDVFSWCDSDFFK